MKQLKLITNFNERTLEYGAALEAYNKQDKKCQDRPGGWPNNGTKLLKDLGIASANLNRAKNRAETALATYAKYMARQAEKA